MKIDFANLQRQYQIRKIEIDSAIQEVLNQSDYIMGKEVFDLEKNLCEFVGSPYTISCSSGTDALLMSLMALGIGNGDEVITTPFTFVSTVEVILRLGAKPVFVDLDPFTYNLCHLDLETKVTKKTKGIIPVSLFGQPCNMEEILILANRYNLFVLEDAAQSLGAEYKQKKSGNLSEIACTSFFPAKPLGCFGDGGAIFTSDIKLADKLRSIRVHGQGERYHYKQLGIGGRLDTIQAAVLNIKLKYFDQDILKRRVIAQQYDLSLKNKVVIPLVSEDVKSTYAQYVIQVENREELVLALNQLGIPTAVHYPIPLHLQDSLKCLNYKVGDFPVCEALCHKVLSIPMNPCLTDDEVNYISESICNLTT
ncbi:MAG: DegT/DnrJ/EryC1/StrS family aminotransferase [Candidatus Cloacimonetes bacterium]|nr:DegT/DnrJ/EryC1/StrS family aminotransferase [Candidatus Cloacimonadota bacterium]